MRTAIIDDNFHNREMLVLFLQQYCPCAEVVGQADSMTSGIDLINELQPELLMLDIELGDGTGYDLLRTVNDPGIKVVFVTAYHDHLEENIVGNVMGLLNKPLSGKAILEMADKIRLYCQTN